MEERMDGMRISGEFGGRGTITHPALLFSSHPLIGVQTRDLIKSQFGFLPEQGSTHILERNFIENLFERFIYDPGLNRSWQMTDEEFARIKKVDPDFVQKQKDAIKIFNRDSIIRVAKERVIAGDRSIAFVAFDIKSLRAVDIAGHAEHVLRDFAEILHNTATQHQEDFEIVPGRIGGDEFCYLVTSSQPIDHMRLKALHDEVKTQFNKKDVYYGEEGESNESVSVIPPITITKAKAQLKEEPDDTKFSIANDEEKRRKLLVRLLAVGQVPEDKVLNKERGVNTRQYNELIQREKKEISFLSQDFKFWKQDFDIFFKKYSEFTEEKETIKSLIADGRPQLAASLFYLMKDYMTDRLLGREIYRMPDFISHLYSTKRKGRIVMFSLPWLKNFNYAVGSTTTNNIIFSMSEQISERMLSRNFPIIEMGRGSGDFVVFIPEETVKKDVDFGHIIHLPISQKKGLEDLRNTPFFEHIPFFVSSIRFIPEATTDRNQISQIIRNVDGENKMQFMLWLNGEYNKDERRGEELTKFYLEQRELDRKRDMRYWLKRLVRKGKLNKRLTQTINS